MSPVSYVLIHSVISSQVDQQFALTPASKKLGDSGQFPDFQAETPGQPDNRLTKVYMWNITNPEAVMAGEKPNMSEVGPFIYGQGWERFNLTWSNDDKTLAYQERPYADLLPPCSANNSDPEACSVMTDDVKFTVPNIAFFGLYYGAGQVDLPAITAQENSPEGRELVEHFRKQAPEGKLKEFIGNFVQGILIDLLYTIPAMDANVTDFAAFQRSLFFKEVTPKDMAFGYNDTAMWNLYHCDTSVLQLDERLCQQIGHEPCATWLPKCEENILYRTLGVCKDIENIAKLMKYLSANCFFKTMTPPMFPGLGFFNLTMEQAQARTGVDRTNSLYTGKMPKDQEFQMTQVNGLKNVVLCGNSLNRTGLPCPGDANATQPYKYPNGSAVYGSQGNQFQHPLNGKETLNLWVDPASRTVQVVHNKVKRKVRGIELYRYVLEPSTLENTTTNPDADAYFQYGPKGFFNYSQAQHGAPIFLCQPHFYGVEDEDVVGNVVGVSPPTEDEHAFALDVEPITGAVMDGAGRVQVNLVPEPLAAGPLAKNHFNTDTYFAPLGTFQSKLYLPVLWIADGGTVSAATANKWKSTLGLALTVRTGLAIGMAVLGFVFLVGSGAVLILDRRRKHRQAEAPLCEDVKGSGLA